MRNYLLLAILLLVSIDLSAREERNYLQNRYTEDFVRDHIVLDDSWISYPAYEDRAAWERFPVIMREKYIQGGEKYLNYTWPVIQATDYLEFSRSGDRQIMERPYNKRRTALQTLIMAELMEGKGRFLDDIINGVFSFCEQTYWGYSAHFYMYKEDETPGQGVPSTNLPDMDNPIVDIGVGEVVADLSWIHYFFQDEFEKISPVINRRIEREIRRKVLEPFYERMDYWWLTGWKRGIVNNWNPWCNTNLLTAIMLMEKDPDVKAKAIYKTMISVDLFYNVYPNDGACDEGPSYWGAAGAKAFEYLDLLSKISNDNINIFDEPLIRDIGSYIYRVYISQGNYFINFSDAPGKISQGGGNIYRYGDKIGDDTMKAFGAFFLHRDRFDTKNPTGPLSRVFEDLFNLEGWQQTAPLEPLIREYYFPDMQVAIARDHEGTNDGFYLAAKGGDNGEEHNHNDVGTCIIFYNGNPVIVDAGVGTYTAQTFSSRRYEIWSMQSTYHNLPLINGVAQKPGRESKAIGSTFKASKSVVSFFTDIALAYPKEANVEKWVRGYTLIRNKGIKITDQFCLTENNGQTEQHFISPLACSVIKPGLIEIKGADFTISMKYNPQQYDVSIEQKEMDDPKMKNVWGESLSVIVLKMAAKIGDYTIHLKAEKH